MIPYSRQDISEADIEAVVEVLKSNLITQGPVVPRFEKVVSQFCDAKYAIAVNSATSALHIACLALDLGPGDWLWTTPNTFVASSNCALYCGAKVDFVDIDPHTYNISSNKLREKLERADKEDCLPKILVVVHFAGQPCDMPEIHKLSQKYGFKIIEDASHAIGAYYACPTNTFSFKSENIKIENGDVSQIKVGSCAHSHITVFSFHPVKIITTGEGGMALTNDIKLMQRLQLLRSHGITRERALMQKYPSDEIWNYQQIELGFNYRMTDIQAALGIKQMTRLQKFLKCRHEIAKKYNDELKILPIILPWQAPGTSSSYHLYPIRIYSAQEKITQRQVYDMFWKNKIAVNLHYIPVHLHPYYKKKGFKVGDFPEAEKYYRETISLPIYPTLLEQDQEYVIKLLSSKLSR